MIPPDGNGLFIITIGPTPGDEAVCGNCGGAVDERGHCQDEECDHSGSVRADCFGPKASKNGKYVCTGTIDDVMNLVAYLSDCGHEVQWEDAAAGIMSAGDLSDFLEPRDV